MAALDRMSLYPFQKEGIAFATNREASLIADDMGLGKTAQAVGVITMRMHLFAGCWSSIPRA